MDTLKETIMSALLLRFQPSGEWQAALKEKLDTLSIEGLEVMFRQAILAEHLEAFSQELDKLLSYPC
ncbi:MAG: hypothetical protein R2880_10295 [Deinococcales bacterium]